jgi:uncharacterized protein GlcG (DUF336 family)
LGAERGRFRTPINTGGNCRAFASSHGASPGRFAIAQAKAYGAVMLGMPSSRLK